MPMPGYGYMWPHDRIGRAKDIITFQQNYFLAELAEPILKTGKFTG